VEDKGASLVRTLDIPARNRSDTPWCIHPRMCVDVKRELLYVRMVERVRFINSKAPVGRVKVPAERLVAIVFKAADETGLPPALILAKLEIESHYNPRAVSSSGARGLAQIVKSTAKELGLPWEQAFHVEQSVLHGARYLKSRIERTGSIRSGLDAYVGHSDPDYPHKVFAVQTTIERR
jgi:soluble lytic murein transglycosylase-like protein